MFTVESRRTSATLGWRAAGTARSVKYLRFERMIARASKLQFVTAARKSGAIGGAIEDPSRVISNRITATLKPPKRNRIAPLISSLLNPATAGMSRANPFWARFGPQRLPSVPLIATREIFGPIPNTSAHSAVTLRILLQRYRFAPGYTISRLTSYKRWCDGFVAARFDA